MTGWSGAAAAATLLGVGWWLRRRFFVVTMLGRSMLPTYADRDRVLVRRRGPGGRVRIGEVVVADLSHRLGPRAGAPPAAILIADRVIKRVAAGPGDPVPAVVTAQEARVPAGRFVLLGDNPAESADSRHYGYVPDDRVIGVVLRHLR